MSHSTCNHNTHHEGDCESACCRGCDRRLGLVSSLCIECCHDTAEAARESIARGLIPAFPAYDAGETICTGCESMYVANSEEAEYRWGNSLRDRRHGVCGTCSTRFELKTLTDCYKKCPSCAMPAPVGPRLITAAEVLAERTALRSELGYIPHGTGRGWSSMLWVYCDCPNCRDHYDPTGEESAKYLNMDHTSFFRGQSDQPSFAFSKIAKESFLAHSKPGFYVGNNTDCLSLEEVQAIALEAPLILHIAANRVWNEFIPSEDKKTWRRRTYKKGHSWSPGTREEQDEYRNVPADQLLARLAAVASE